MLQSIVFDTIGFLLLRAACSPTLLHVRSALPCSATADCSTLLFLTLCSCSHFLDSNERPVSPMYYTSQLEHGTVASQSDSIFHPCQNILQFRDRFLGNYEIMLGEHAWENKLGEHVALSKRKPMVSKHA